ncbi:glycoside hydrolase family 3 protein [Aurantibacillus circumpalustris]|uniref:glycoside hydrolase family 3 protein n=1 Tax=Aurantibacillus circumpalustris TaxID=3036359 RepID=UPI00295C37A3|nr:glycoside hydrolase family 3 N-terminal domain-containing protein [Aurantibacillus circumpalustris]
MLKKIILLLILFTISFVFISMIVLPKNSDINEELAKDSNDSLDLKIGQMIMMGIKSRTSVSENDSLLQEIREHKLGGVVLFEKNISPANSRNELINLISTIQAAAAIPLFISIDEEGGLVHRLKEKYGFVGMPSAMRLGKINSADCTLFYNRRLTAELSELGFNCNYAPTLDMAVNPENTVIVKRQRSFSEDPDIVSKHALLCIQAHHENNIKTILKHFPGHGSSTADSHAGIVDVTESWSFKELYPYFSILSSGSCDAIMTAHIINKRWDDSYLPATLSKRVVIDMLRGLLGYKGVVFSDDMQMGAISKNYGFENAIELAINAGVDVLMFANNVGSDQKMISASEVHAVIKKMVKKKKISRERINEAYSRIILLKNKKYF